MSANASSLSAHRVSAATHSTSSQARPFSWGGYACRGLGTIAAAVVANALFYYLGSGLVTYNPEFLPLGNVSGAAIFTIVPAIVAVLLYAALLRFTRHPAGIFNVIAAIVFVVTLIPDFTYIPTVAGSSPEQTAILVLMHAVAAGVIVRLLTASPRPAR
jgi:tryptophan-rich sensory protein